MTTPTNQSDTSFDQLIATVAACRACPTMEGRRRVLSRLNGRVDARVLFIAEAPGRFGAELTGVPLSNDQSGRNFGRFLVEAGLGRDEIFITNAVLCNPQNERGRNRPPTQAELGRCAVHLRAQLALITAPVVVTLGAVALRAIEVVQPHGLSLSTSVARVAN
ncbi:MAG TPA: uracil-DNA glycosylase [Chloroflexota bacterium]|nr:uracil-DNA glycosylase [Chloroflexota bacterium]